MEFSGARMYSVMISRTSFCGHGTNKFCYYSSKRSLTSANSYLTKLFIRSYLTNFVYPRSYSPKLVHDYSSDVKSNPVLSSYDYCVDVVKRSDYDNFLCSLLLPADCRRTVFVVRAFNCELAKINEQTSTRIAGLGRLQFWKDVVSKIYDGRPLPDNPVAAQLNRAVKTSKFNKKWLLDLVEARQERLGDPAFDSLRSLEDYCQKTVGSCLFLTLQAMGIQNVHADHVASHVAKAQGIVNTLRAAPAMAKRGKVVLPTELMLHHGVSQTAIIRSTNDENVKNLAHDIAGQAHIHMEHARKLRTELPALSSIAFLSGAVVDGYLTALANVDFNLFHPQLVSRNRLLPWKLLWRKIRRTY